MADGNDYQGLMSSFAGAFFGGIIGGIISIIFYAILSYLNVDSNIIWVVVAACIIIGAVALGFREYKKHGSKKV